MEKEIQEEAAFKGARCLLGEGGQDCALENVGTEVQVLNHINHNGSSFNPFSDDVGHFLNSLNIKLIMANKEKGSGRREEVPSVSKRSGARELCNLVFNVNYEKGLRGQGKKCSQ